MVVWSHAKFLLLSSLLGLATVIIMLYSVTSTTMRTKGVTILELKLPSLRARFHISDAKDEASKVVTRAKDVATKVASEASSKATAALGLMDDLPKQLTVGSDQICWQYTEAECRPIPSDFQSWFPEPIQKLVDLSDGSTSLKRWIGMKIRACMIATTVGFFFFFSLVLAFDVLQITCLNLTRLLQILVSLVVGCLIFVPLVLAVVITSRISASLKGIKAGAVTDGNLGQWLLVSLGLASLSVATYAVYRLRSQL